MEGRKDGLLLGVQKYWKKTNIDTIEKNFLIPPWTQIMQYNMNGSNNCAFIVNFKHVITW